MHCKYFHTGLTLISFSPRPGNATFREGIIHRTESWGHVFWNKIMFSVRVRNWPTVPSCAPHLNREWHPTITKNACLSKPAQSSTQARNLRTSSSAQQVAKAFLQCSYWSAKAVTDHHTMPGLEEQWKHYHRGLDNGLAEGRQTLALKHGELD